MQIKLIMYLDKIDLTVILIYIFTPYIQSIDHCLKTIWIVHEVHVTNLNNIFSLLHKFTSVFEIFCWTVDRRIVHPQKVQFSTINSWQQEILCRYTFNTLERSVQRGKKILVFVIKKCVTFFQNNLNTAI